MTMRVGANNACERKWVIMIRIFHRELCRKLSISPERLRSLVEGTDFPQGIDADWDYFDLEAVGKWLLTKRGGWGKPTPIEEIQLIDSKTLYMMYWVSASQISRYKAERELPYYYFGYRNRFCTKEIDAWIHREKIRYEGPMRRFPDS